MCYDLQAVQALTQWLLRARLRALLFCMQAAAIRRAEAKARYPMVGQGWYILPEKRKPNPLYADLQPRCAANAHLPSCEPPPHLAPNEGSCGLAKAESTA